MTVLSKNKTKFIKSLHLKKYRKHEQQFLVEGTKSVLELLNANYQVIMLLVTQKFWNQHQNVISSANIQEIFEVSPAQLSSVSTFKQNQDVLAIAIMPEQKIITPQTGEWWLALDNIQDPGNLGTIIRTADWYGIKNIVASTETAEFYNPKVIQATMGSFCRVNVFYYKLIEFISSTPLNVFGAYLNGANIHDYKFDSAGGGIFLLGNEANGISADLEKNVSVKISIPRFGQAESLNAGIATAVILDNWKRSI